jgi:uncharacterized membrane protein YozB (DUF420 family)
MKDQAKNTQYGTYITAEGWNDEALYKRKGVIAVIFYACILSTYQYVAIADLPYHLFLITPAEVDLFLHKARFVLVLPHNE